MLASVPELQKRTSSSDGTRSHSSRASRACDFVRSVPAGTAGGLLPDGPDQRGVGVAVDQRGGIVREVEQSVAVHVVEVISLAAVHVGRIGGKRRASACFTARQPGLSTLVQFARPRRAATVFSLDALA